MTENNTQAAECLSHLTAELDTTSDELDLMEVFVDGTEISHYLMGHINDIGNLQPWQRTVCTVGAVTIDRLRDKVRKLQATIEREAEYCYGWAASAEMMGDDDRAKRQKERGDRLMASI